MNKRAELIPSMLELLESQERNWEAAQPSQIVVSTRGQKVVAGIWISCRHLFSAIRVLLGERLTEEAKILLRTLIENAVTLRYLEANADQLEYLARCWEFGSIKEEIGLWKAAVAKIGGPTLGHPAPPDTEGELAQLKSESAKLGVPSLRSLPDFTDMLRKIDLGNYALLIKMKSHAVHTSRLSIMNQLREISPDRFVDWLGPAGDVLLTGGTASDSFSWALLSTAKLLGWESLPAAQSFADQVFGQIHDIAHGQSGIAADPFGTFEEDLAQAD